MQSKKLFAFLLLVCLLSACAGQPVQPVSAPAAVEPVAAATCVPCATGEPADIPAATTLSDEREVEGWAVLAAKEDYSELEPQMTPLNSGFIQLYGLRGMLGYYGWKDDHIREIRDELSPETLKDAMDWLETQADENDVIFLYIAGHGNFMRYVLKFDELVPDEWAQLPGGRRVLVLDSCQAGGYISSLRDDPNPFIAIGAVGADELGWAGLWKEGLPILGGVFSHYFTADLLDPTTDADQDGVITVAEASARAGDQQTAYIQDVVWQVPEFAGNWANGDEEYPHLAVIDRTKEKVFFDLRSYPENGE